MQISEYESKLRQRGLGPKTCNWDELSDINDPEEAILTNTYKNSLKNKTSAALAQ